MHLLTSLDFGGVESRARIVHRCAPQSKFKHRFCALAGGGATAALLEGDGARVDLLGARSRIPSPQALIRLTRLLRKVRPMVLHCHGAEANFHGLLAGGLARVPARIGEEIGIPSHSRTATTAFKAVYATAHRVIGVSEAVRDWLVESGEVRPNAAVRLYNPVALPEDYSSLAPQDVLRIVFLGRLEHRKNPLGLLEAFASLATGAVPCELWFIGDGRQRAALEREVEAKQLGDRVRFWGFQADSTALLRQCHLFVQASLSEGFGLALVEAMGCGLPVVATNVGAAPELVSDGETGWLIEPTVDQLRAAIERARRLGSANLVALGERARLSVVGRFEPVSYLRQLEALYDAVLEEHAPRRSG